MTYFEVMNARKGIGRILLLILALSLSETGVRAACMAFMAPATHDMQGKDCHDDEDATPVTELDCCAFADSQMPVVKKQLVQVRVVVSHLTPLKRDLTIESRPHSPPPRVVDLSHLTERSILASFLI